MLKNLSTIPLTFFLARRKEALRLPASIESGHTPFFISLLGRVSVCVSGLCPALDLAEREARTPTSSSGISLGTLLTHVNRVRQRHPELYEEIRAVRRGMFDTRWR